MGTNEGPLGIYRLDSVSVWDARVSVISVVFVHLFSGFRRPGDLHWHIEHHDWAHGIECFCLSIDLCLQKEEGDLLDPKRIQWWKERIHARQVMGIGGGPPCKTWTAARWLGGGPPPLRDRAHPWGLPWLSRKHHRQVQVGTGLLQVAVELIMLCVGLGGCGFIEHPQTPTWLYHTPCPSIWRLPMIKALASLSAVAAVSFDQCIFEAPALKPTTFLIARLPHFRVLVLQMGCGGRCPHGPGAHAGLSGMHNGTFRTAKAKVYPPLLNRAIAAAFHAFVHRLRPEKALHRLPDVLYQYISTEAMQDPGEVQPDYHG